MLVVLVGSLVAFALSFAVRSAVGGGFLGVLLANSITDIILFVVAGFLQIGLYRSVLAVTAGQPIVMGEVFSTDNIGPYLVATLLFAVMIGIGSLFCFIPGLVLAFFGFFYAFFVLDQNQSPVDSIKSSFRMVNSNLGQMIPFAIVAFLVYVLGYVACFVGILVTAPIALIAAGFAYRTLNGQPVAP